ncbi:MAG: ferrous iron transporter B [Oscillospiraceae bacterium]|nr:ferrous iron transporter B [Oscillospiraceae bacterium]
MGLTKSSTGMGTLEGGLLLEHLGENDRVVALAGNPNVGKSTVFNALTGMRQHTGNWPGKTVASARGTCQHGGRTYHLIDLPGTYSLHAHSAEEEVARDFLRSGDAHAVVVVCDGTCLERNLNLVLQTIALTENVVVCVNLLDEAARKGITVDLPLLSRKLGVPVVGAAAGQGQGLEELMDVVSAEAEKPVTPRDEEAAEEPVEVTVRKAEAIARACVRYDRPDHNARDRRLDRLLTGRVTGIPLMLLLLLGVFWLTISGANYPSALLSEALFKVQDYLTALFTYLGAPEWLHGLLVLGAYRTLAWVVSVMLPPMAIFFPLFTLLEDFGYLPRIAFVLDHAFQKAHACGKQALTMWMVEKGTQFEHGQAQPTVTIA